MSVTGVEVTKAILSASRPLVAKYNVDFYVLTCVSVFPLPTNARDFLVSRNIHISEDIFAIA